MTSPTAGPDLEYQELNGADFRSTDLRSARMRGTRLQDVDLSGADLRGADLRGALAMWSATSLRGARLDGCDLRDADFSGVDAREVNLEGANLEGSRWDGADLRGATLTRARFGWQSIWLADLAAGRDRRQPASFDDTRLAGATLTEAHLPGISLRRADLRSIKARGAILTGAQLASANLQDADLEDTDLCEADLRDTVLIGAVLRNAALLGARLLGTQLDRAALDRVKLGATVLHRLGPGHLAAGETAIHLAPSFTDHTVPPALIETRPNTTAGGGHLNGASPAGLTCLLVGDTDHAADMQKVRHALCALGVDPYVVTPNALCSPAGPVVTARTADAHPFTVVVVGDALCNPSWVSTLRHTALDKPAWTPHFLVILRVPASGDASERHRYTVDVVGAVPAALHTLVDHLGGLGSDILSVSTDQQG